MKQFQEMLIRQEEELQAVQRSVELNKGEDRIKPEISHWASPDMMAYREGGDTLMVDGRLDTSDELGWQVLRKGKMRDNAESDNETDPEEELEIVSLELE